MVKKIVQKDSTKKFIMLIGLPGSGKTTWRDEYITNNPEFVSISSDDILEELGKEQGYNTYDEAFSNIDFKEVESRMSETLEKYVYDGKNIIWDQTNLTKSSRKSKLNKVPNTYTKYAKIFIIDDETLSKRLSARALSGKTIPHNVLDRMKRDSNYDVSGDGFDYTL